LCRFLVILFSVVVLFGCHQSSLEEIQEKGVAQVELLLQILYKIETREDLSKVEFELKEVFEKLVVIMIEARFVQQKDPEAILSALPMREDRSYSLMAELKRIYALEGGREVIERAEREAMLRLDAKEKMLLKQQQFRGHRK